jgi:hypothetical protein
MIWSPPKPIIPAGDILIPSYFLDELKRINGRLSRDFNLTHANVNAPTEQHICNANSTAGPTQRYVFA